MNNRTVAKTKHQNSTTFSPVFGKKLSDRTFTPEPANKARDVSNPEFGHNFGDVQVESPSFKQSCPLSLSGPAHCPFGGACHTCPPRVQAKLKVGQPGDKYEREADRVAEQVMRMPEPMLQRRRCSTFNDRDEEEQIKTNPIADRITLLVQRQEVDPDEEEEKIVQTKLAINKPGDKYEQEVDMVAEQIMRMPEPRVQRKGCLICNDSDEEEQPLMRMPDSRLQHTSACGGGCPRCRKEKGGHEQLQTTRFQAIGARRTEVPPSVHEILRLPGQSMDHATRTFFEPRFGKDFSQVRLHTDARAAKTVRAMNARAYTVGRDIVFGAGQATTNAGKGRRLLAHELTHVVQQLDGGRPMLQRAETDTAVSCDGLKDTSAKIDERVNKALSNARSKAASQSWSGHQAWADTIIDSVYEELGRDQSRIRRRTKIEEWAKNNLKKDKEIRHPAKSATKYRGVSAMFSTWQQSYVRTIGPTLKVDDGIIRGGICIGTDKLGHFFQQGYEYYVKARREKKGVSAAEEYGHQTEIGKYGLLGTGVYSKADLEANRQGLAFYDRLAKSPGSSFNIRSYINTDWNEETNLNVYDKAIASTVWKNLVTGLWSGAFTHSGTKSNVPVNIVLDATQKGVLTGNYAYRGSKKQVIRGKIEGRVHLLVQRIDPGYQKEVVKGAIISFKWNEGGHIGKGFWRAKNENLLDGTWGWGSSRDDAGLWWAIKQS